MAEDRDGGVHRRGPGDLASLARSVRERLELNRVFGWEVPLMKRNLVSTGPTPPRAAPGKAARAAAAAKLLEPLSLEVSQCRRCALGHTRTQAVFGTGDPTARLMFVGEAPGFDEDRQGEPFVGKAGRLLTDIIRAMGLRRDQVYIANVIKCRPPNNRLPNLAEIGSCRGYLERQIEVVAPEVLVALGSVAAKALLGTDLSIGRLRGRFHEFRLSESVTVPLMPTYHPAYLLRNPAEKRKVWEDVQLVMARLGLVPGASRPPEE